MKKSDELKQELEQKVNEQRSMLDLKEKESRDFTEDEVTKFNTLHNEIEDLDKRKKQALKEEAAAQRAAEMAGASGVGIEDTEEKEKQEIYKRFSILKALNDINPANHARSLDGAEKEVHEIGIDENKRAKVSSQDSTLSIPLSYLNQRATAQTVTEDSGNYGGNLVQNQAPRMVEPLRPKLAFEELGASFLTGLSGGNIPLIVDNDFTMTFIAETASATVEKKTFAGPTLNPKRAAGAVEISNQLLLQSSVDVDDRVARGLVNGFRQALHTSIINGGGGVDITGLLNLSDVNASSQTAAAAATWARIVELQGLIEEDDATEVSLGYLMHPKLKAALKQVTKDAGSGRFLLEGMEVDGYKYISTSLVPVLDASGTDVYPLIYGDFAQMVIGQWGSINVSINPYSADLSNSVRLVLNTHADMQIANQKAFAKNAWLSE